MPDFGYGGDDPTSVFDTEDRHNTSGWRMVFDYFKKEPRLVRLQKIVKQRLQEKIAKEKKGSSMRNASVKV